MSNPHSIIILRDSNKQWYWQCSDSNRNHPSAAGPYPTRIAAQMAGGKHLDRVHGQESH